ncbi:tRNA-guanine transglycosylase DpdA [Pannus brasiliensis CCIBt3594]|uniref:tRNA-guanine transglycosylase DpdA n=1 Tax=Pannus brasiliensis CCIBt3594 TaxID=1427578 RepID=A0AAW9QZ71_9CHRO
MSYPRILVVTSCTGEKRDKDNNQLTLEDFKDPESLKIRTEELEAQNRVCPAHEMYRGVQHLRVMEGVKILRKALSGGVVDLAIISAGYGLIKENDRIAPYEVTFKTMKGEEIDEWAKKLKIRESFETIIKNYNLIFVLLGEQYLRSLQLPIETSSQQKIIFLASPSSRKYLYSSSAPSFVLPLSNLEAKQYGYGLVGLKGFLFKQFAQKIALNPQLIQIFFTDPMSFISFLDVKTEPAIQLNLLSEKIDKSYNNINDQPVREITQESGKLYQNGLEQNIFSGLQDRAESVSDLIQEPSLSKNGLDLIDNSSFINEVTSDLQIKSGANSNHNNHIAAPGFPPKMFRLNKSTRLIIRGRSEIDRVIPIPNIPPAKNYHLGMKYFIPEWNDHVDPGFDFLKDRLTANRDPHDDEVYAHEIFSPFHNYDGILVSRTIFDKGKKKRDRIFAEGIRRYIRFNNPIMGDCGAFGYIAEEEPPYKTEDILSYYEKVGFNYGVSIDHLIVGDFAKPGIREKRYELTINNAREFIQKYKEGQYKFTPIGAVQGWDIPSYIEAVKQYIEMQYNYIALGGLARATTSEIIEILYEISPLLTSETKLHLFGVGRLNAIPIFRHLGVTSFDSASPLRKAWLDPAANYHSSDDKIYAAVRIPSINSAKVKQVIKEGIASREVLQDLEQKALSSLREFDAGTLSLEETLQTLLDYDKFLEKPENGTVCPQKLAARLQKHEKIYRQLLEDKPWQKCSCEICSKIGVESIIFRGNDRNRRRGFHNTYMFYKRFQELLKKYDALSRDQNISYNSTISNETDALV